MTKKTQEDIKQSPAETPDELPSEKIKRSFKQRLGRLLMITETKDKDKKLNVELRSIKDTMYETFCKEGIWKSEYINRMFRLYADKNKDIKILKPQFKLFSKYIMSIPGIDENESIRITQYLKTLRFIRAWLNPIVQDIKALAKQANDHATEQLKMEGTEEIFSVFDNETNAESHHTIAKKYFKDALENEFLKHEPLQKYNDERFLQEQTIIGDCFEDHDYQDLMIFALLWFHYFGKKNEVYDAFLPEQLETQQISFTIRQYNPTTISLWAFLKIIENLDFKKHIFMV